MSTIIISTVFFILGVVVAALLINRPLQLSIRLIRKDETDIKREDIAAIQKELNDNKPDDLDDVYKKMGQDMGDIRSAFEGSDRING